MTKTDLIAEVLGKLRAIQGGATVGGGDAAKVGTKYDAVYKMLDAKHIATWTATDDIPDTHSHPVITIVAYYCADDYEVTEQRMHRLKVEAVGEYNERGEGGAVGEIRALAHIPYVSTEDPEYY